MPGGMLANLYLINSNTTAPASSEPQWLQHLLQQQQDQQRLMTPLPPPPSLPTLPPPSQPPQTVTPSQLSIPASHYSSLQLRSSSPPPPPPNRRPSELVQDFLKFFSRSALRGPGQAEARAGLRRLEETFKREKKSLQDLRSLQKGTLYSFGLDSETAKALRAAMKRFLQAEVEDYEEEQRYFSGLALSNPSYSPLRESKASPPRTRCAPAANPHRLPDPPSSPMPRRPSPVSGPEFDTQIRPDFTLSEPDFNSETASTNREYEEEEEDEGEA
jgi:hypothetical protein